VETGREQPVVTPRSFPRGDNEFLTTPAYSPDGERIAFVRHDRSNPKNGDATEIWIVPATGGIPVPLADVKGAQWAPTWSPDGKRIAVAGAGPSVNLYDAETGALTASCKGHSAGIYSVAFSPDSAHLATGGFDGQVRLYRTADCTLEKAFIPVPLVPNQVPSAGGMQ